MSAEPARALPRGRHSLSREQVLESQRERLLQAMLVCVGEHGYAATTVPQVVAAARVSRNGFYALFADKLDCFLALCDRLGEYLLKDLYAYGVSPDWELALDRGMGAYLRWWRERPEFARAYLVELPSAGPRALEQRDARLRDFEAMFVALAKQAGATPNPLTTRLLAAGITELIAAEVRAGRTDRLDDLHDELVALVHSMLQA